jgi:Mn-dependent DtxR family transcriptional regulator
VNWGFKKSTVSRVLRETNRDGLTLERYRLYRITERGYEIVNLLLKDSRLLEWINRTSINTKWIESYTSRPNVMKLEQSLEKSDLDKGN